MKVRREGKGNPLDPASNRRHLLLFLLPSHSKLVGKVSVQVNAADVEAARPAQTLPLNGRLEAVRVHGGHDVDARILQQVLHVGISAGGVAGDQVLDQVQQQLTANCLQNEMTE